MSDPGISHSQPTEDPYAGPRRSMVQDQLAARGIRDPDVLRVMGELPRERFVAESPAIAYDDRALPIGFNQTISQPYMVAVMTQTLRLERHHRVLEIGTGSGYQCAVLARLAAEVWTIERIGELAERAQKALAELGITNVHYRVADGSLGWPEHAPFDRILITAGAPEVPKPLLEQLVTGGLMVLPVGPTDQQMLVEVEQREGRWTERSVLACRFVRLIGQAGWPNGKAGADSPGGWY